MRNMLEMTASAAPFSLVTSLNHIAYKVMAFAQSSPLGERANDAAEHLPWLEPIRKVGTATVAYAGGVILSRASGAITTIDELFGGQGGTGMSNASPLNLEVHGGSKSLVALERPLAVPVAESSLHLATTKGTGDIHLPANIAKAPPAIDLPKYNSETGVGTLWHVGEVYAQELGFGDLTEHQEHVAATQILHAEGVSWHEARSLHVGRDINLPTQTRMIDALEDAGAKITHTPDRPVIDKSPPPLDLPETPAPRALPNPLPTSEGGTIYACNAPDPWRGWLTKWDFGCEYNDAEEAYLTMATVAGGVVLAAALAGGGIMTYKRREDFRRHDTVASRNRTVGPLPLKRDPQPKTMDPGGVMGPPVAGSPLGIRPTDTPPPVYLRPEDKPHRIPTGPTTAATVQRHNEQVLLDEEQAKHDAEVAAAQDDANEAKKDAKSAKRSATLAWMSTAVSSARNYWRSRKQTRV